MDGSNYTAQGRSQEFADDRIKRKLKSKGCIKDAKTEVIRISLNKQLTKIYRCPRAVTDDLGVVSHYSDYLSCRNGGLIYRPQEYPAKWHKIQAIVRNEVAKVEKQKRDEEDRRQKQTRNTKVRRS